MPKKSIHAICRNCHKLFKNFLKVENDNKLENLKIFTCKKCQIETLTKKWPGSKVQLFIL